MKYLLLFAILFVVYLAWRNARVQRGGGTPPPAGRPGQPQEMVSCPVCGLHLPRQEALVGPSGRYFCCVEHRARAGG
jgi:uncharacterized protein